MYQVWLSPTVHETRKILPGGVRQRIRRIIDGLTEEPRPANSIEMTLDQVPQGWEIRRIRVEAWRIIYAIDAELKLVAVLGIRKRPPYDYDDLEALLNELE